MFLPLFLIARTCKRSNAHSVIILGRLDLIGHSCVRISSHVDMTNTSRFQTSLTVMAPKQETLGTVVLGPEISKGECLESSSNYISQGSSLGNL